MPATDLLPVGPAAAVESWLFILAPRLDGSGRPAELVGVAQPGARGPEVRGLGGEAAVGRVRRTRL